LLLEQPKIMAEIDLLKAQAAKLLADIGADKAATQLAAFEMAIKSFEAYHGALNDRIKAITGGKKDEGAPNGGDVPRLEGPSGQPATPGNAGGMAQGLNGAMGGGALSS